VSHRRGSDAKAPGAQAKTGIFTLGRDMPIPNPLFGLFGLFGLSGLFGATGDARDVSPLRNLGGERQFARGPSGQQIAGWIAR
jgi:hypothetical protein